MLIIICYFNTELLKRKSSRRSIFNCLDVVDTESRERHEFSHYTVTLVTASDVCAYTFAV